MRLDNEVVESLVAFLDEVRSKYRARMSKPERDELRDWIEDLSAALAEEGSG